MRDYSELEGQQIGYLFVEKVLPREKGPNGRLKNAEAICRCVCGVVRKYACTKLAYGRVQSCGCKKGHTEGKCLNRTYTQYAKVKCYHCHYPEPSCTYANVLHVCCHECPERLGCARGVCSNTPDKCGARYDFGKQELIEFIYGKEIMEDELEKHTDS